MMQKSKELQTGYQPFHQLNMTDLNKKDFGDAISLRYELKGLPSKYTCGKVYYVTLALNCKRTGLYTEAQLLKQTFNDVEVS